MVRPALIFREMLKDSLKNFSVIWICEYSSSRKPTQEKQFISANEYLKFVKNKILSKKFWRRARLEASHLLITDQTEPHWSLKCLTLQLLLLRNK